VLGVFHFVVFSLDSTHNNHALIVIWKSVAECFHVAILFLLVSETAKHTGAKCWQVSDRCCFVFVMFVCSSILNQALHIDKDTTCNNFEGYFCRYYFTMYLHIRNIIAL